MKLMFMLILALLPAIILLMYIWRKDQKKEPTSRLSKAVLLGIAICFPVTIIELGIRALLFGVDGQPTSIAETTTMAFIVAALPEETFKLLALWLALRKNPFFDEHFDGIVYAVCVGLGFAAVENIGYVLSYDEWISVAISRSLLAVPGHYAFAVLMGYYYSLYHFVDHSPKIAACILFVPVAAHGFYDTLALSGSLNPYIGGLSFFVLIWFCIKMHKYARTKIVAQIERDRNSMTS